MMIRRTLVRTAMSWRIRCKESIFLRAMTQVCTGENIFRMINGKGSWNILPQASGDDDLEAHPDSSEISIQRNFRKPQFDLEKIVSRYYAKKFVEMIPSLQFLTIFYLSRRIINWFLSFHVTGDCVDGRPPLSNHRVVSTDSPLHLNEEPLVECTNNLSIQHSEPSPSGKYLNEINYRKY